MILILWALCGILLAALPPSPAPPVVKNGWITTSDGVRLHYLEAGNGQSLVFEPGWTMPAEIWEPQIRHFSQRYRVIALDPRSQGESGQTNEGHYPERRAQDIKELVEQLRLEPAVLAGWSLGVPEVLTYVDRFGTSTLRAVVLVDGPIGSDPNLQGIIGSFARLKQMQLDRAGYTDRFVRGMYKKPHSEEYYRKVIAASLKTPTNTALTLLANLFVGLDLRPALAKLDRPVLYTITARLEAQADMLRARLPSARVEVFEQAGHALFVDEPEHFNKVLEEFLAGIP